MLDSPLRILARFGKLVTMNHLGVLRFALPLAIWALVFAVDAEEVAPRQLYEVSFKARVAKGPTVEESPQYREILRYCDSDPSEAGVPFCSVRWTFLDRKGGKPFVRNRLYPYGITVASREWRTYRTRLYVPDGVTWLELKPTVGRKGDEMELDEVSVRNVPRGETLNVNPEMQWRDGCLGGWKPGRDARPELAEPGRTRLYVEEGWALSEPFPVEPGMKFALTMHGAPCVHDRFQNRVGCNVTFGKDSAAMNDLKNACKKAETRLLVFDDEWTKTETYVVPEGMRWATLAPSYGTVDYLGAKEVK